MEGAAPIDPDALLIWTKPENPYTPNPYTPLKENWRKQYPFTTSSSKSTLAPSKKSSSASSTTSSSTSSK